MLIVVFVTVRRVGIAVARRNQNVRIRESPVLSPSSLLVLRAYRELNLALVWRLSIAISLHVVNEELIQILFYLKGELYAVRLPLSRALKVTPLAALHASLEPVTVLFVITRRGVDVGVPNFEAPRRVVTHVAACYTFDYVFLSAI